MNNFSDNKLEPMTFAGSGTMAEEAQKSVMPPIAEGQFNIEVFDYGMVEEDETDWTSGVPIKTGGKVKRLKVVFKLVSRTDGAEILDVNGQPPKSNLRSKKLDLNKIAYSRGGKTKGQPHDARVVLTALFGLPTVSAIPKFDENTLIGKTAKCYLELVTKENGEQYNVLGKFVPTVTPVSKT